MAETSIEWTDRVSGRLGLEQLSDGPRPGDRTAAQTIEAALVQACDPQHRVLVPLPAVAGPARRHQVARGRLATSADRDEVVESHRRRIAVCAALSERLLAPPRRDASHAPASRPEAPSRRTGVVVTLGRPVVRQTSPTVDLAAGQPPAAVTAPCQAHGRHGATLGDPGAGGGASADPAGPARGRQAVGARGVPAEAAERVPGAASVAPLLAARSTAAVLVDRHADTTCRCGLNPCAAAHGPDSPTWDQMPEAVTRG